MNSVVLYTLHIRISGNRTSAHKFMDKIFLCWRKQQGKAITEEIIANFVNREVVAESATPAVLQASSSIQGV